MACYIAKDVTQTWIEKAIFWWHFQLQPRSSSYLETGWGAAKYCPPCNLLEGTLPGTSIHSKNTIKQMEIQCYYF